MQRKLLHFSAIVLLALVQLFAVQHLQAQTQDNGFLLRVTIDGVSSTYAQGECGWGYALFGGVVTEDICGTPEWARSVVSDTLGCDTITQSLAGKWALVRRKTCNFSLKAYYAQQAGAEAVIILNHFDNVADNGCTPLYMSAGTNADLVTIPVISVGRDIGTKIDEALAAGKTVETCFVFPRLYNAVAAYHYATPVTQIDTLNNIGVRFVNREVNDVSNVVITAEVKDPNGVKTVLQTPLSSVSAGVDTFVYLPAYLPTVLGRYDVTYSNSYYTEPRDTVKRAFQITPYTFATDNLKIDPLGVSSTAEVFAASNFQQQSGGLCLTGPNGGIGAFATFGIANAAAIAGTGADDITVILYDGDPDNDGVIDLTGGFTDLDNLPGGQAGFGTYTMTGLEPVDSLITIPLTDFSNGDPVVLKARHPYYISLLYNGSNGTTGSNIAFSNTVDELYLNFPTTPLFLDQLYSGYSGAAIIQRLQMEGYPANLVSVKPTFLDASKVVIAPNPANDQIRLDINLAKVNDAVTVSLIDWTGRFVSTQLLKNFQNGQTTFDVSTLPSGTYLVQVSAGEGVTMRKVSVCH